VGWDGHFGKGGVEKKMRKKGKGSQRVGFYAVLDHFQQGRKDEQILKMEARRTGRERIKGKEKEKGRLE